MQRARYSAVFLLLIALIAQPLPAANKKKDSKSTLGARIDKILDQTDVSRGFWGIEVVSLNSGATLYSRNADKLFTPASNTKLFTTATAMALIGPDYRFRTTVETTGAIDKYGRLNGDLILVGRGDPNLSGRTLPYNTRTERKLPPAKVLADLADQVVQKGLKYVDGDIVGDDSWYAFERYGEGWTQDDLVWEWGAPVSALTINDNVVFVDIMPADRAGEKAFINLNPFPEYYRVDNRILTTPPGTQPRKIYINREPGSNQITFWGNIPLDDSGAHEALAIEDPANFAAQLFRSLLEQRGVVVYGRPRTRHTELAKLSTITVTTTASAQGGGGGSEVPPNLFPKPVVLASYDSQPFLQDLRVINKVSQNLHAELTLRLLGREKGANGTIESGLEVVHGFLTQAGIQGEEYVFYDGSGLSRQNLVTPHAIVKLLSYASVQPWYAAFRDTLPVAGMDGSLADRFRNSPALGHVFAKTGSLGHVNALSGYVKTAGGDTLVFSVIANNHNLTSRRALETIDLIVEQMVAEK
ncbi:MAG TPA: D-alanyl-D-alanine carboxypeptidase/D-alanyl-D-alanine-endopeptidase [Terriglobales bacterium]|nr:D-alanyl-D-alanine carboxypeptidase/D-alanyl-D-alanine-endopeptidase [Terriglobales bacterium]